jgi:lipopolysaccharide export system permease protein
MRVPRILALYMGREILLYTVIGFLAVGAIMVSQNLLRRIDELAAVGFSAHDSLDVLRCLFGILSAYVVPVAFLFGVLVAFGRFSADSEITAMRSCGLGMRSLVGPPLLMGLGVTLLTGFLILDVEPSSRRELRRVLSSIASRGALVEPGRFTNLDSSQDRLLLVQNQNEAGALEGVMISDRSNPARPFTVFAELGTFSFEPEASEIHLLLENGSIHFEPGDAAEGRYQYIGFRSLDYGLDASSLLKNTRKVRPREMTLAKIQAILAYFDEHGGPPPGLREKKREPYEIQIHRRLALPLAPLLFALVGVPLAMRRTRGAHSYGMLVCVALVFAYYTVLSLGEYAGEQGLLPASLALWLPNLAFAVVAFPLLRRMRYAEI